ncbi:MAG: M23 family metallopeptidase [Candidatus Omnitrophota bacterium]|jgi:murein DD-endopeptidase MepM/ murein hydrolase activator NlpD
MSKKYLFAFLIFFLICIISALYFIDKVYFLCPIEYKKNIIIRNDDYGKGDFGALRSGGRRHKGIDLYAQVGTDIRAVRFGRVKETGFHKGLGNYVELYHQDDLVTIYGHLQQVLVREGQWVAQGRIVGKTGKTGNANNPRMLSHLHFEIRKDNIPIDPLGLLEGK